MRAATFASTLTLEQGIHPEIVSERLGHSDVSLTLNIYSRVLPAMQDQAAEKLDQLLVPIEVSDKIRKLGEKQSTYVASVAKGAHFAFLDMRNETPPSSSGGVSFCKSLCDVVGLPEADYQSHMDAVGFA